MTIRERVAEKMFSGKWLLTVTAGVCLLGITASDCVLALRGQKPFVDPAALLSIITAVVMAYFGRSPDRPTDGTESK